MTAYALAPAFGQQVALLTKAGLRAAFARQHDLKAPRRIAPAQAPRSGRSGAQERRSRLTATGRRGPAEVADLARRHRPSTARPAQMARQFEFPELAVNGRAA